MSERAFLIAGDRATAIANDISDERYRARVHYIPVGAQIPMSSNSECETQFMLEDGMLAFMVGGAATLIGAPEHIRVPPGVAYAYRNVGNHTARLLMRVVRPAPVRSKSRLVVEYAA